MSELFSARRRTDDRERAALVKARVSVEDAAAALLLDSPLGVVSPCCEAVGMLTIAASGETWACEAPGCEATGDAISLVRLARDCGFRSACEFLETEVLSQSRCRKTRDLFDRRDNKSSAPAKAGASLGGRRR